MIRLCHPQHGEMNVDGPADVERNAPFGWMVKSDTTVYNDSTPSEAQAAPADPPPAQATKRRGRPPKGA